MPNGHEVSILIVEDDPGHARLIEKNLKRSNITNSVTAVSDGQQALDFLFGEGAFAGKELPAQLLVLLDLNMPVLDGYQVLERMKADPRTTTHPRHRPDDDRRPARSRPLLRARLQRLHHEACGLREVRRRDREVRTPPVDRRRPGGEGMTAPGDDPPPVVHGRRSRARPPGAETPRTRELDRRSGRGRRARTDHVRRGRVRRPFARPQHAGAQRPSGHRTPRLRRDDSRRRSCSPAPATSRRRSRP